MIDEDIKGELKAKFKNFFLQFGPHTIVFPTFFLAYPLFIRLKKLCLFRFWAIDIAAQNR